ncbi:MAG TPA: ABC transporter ATP-binding protein [Stellaceae bacterium]|nr:ABC transporter ATP-binding protein [Stellaceae bacterium]
MPAGRQSIPNPDPTSPPRKKPKLSVRGLSKTYGPVTALADASLDLGEGEFLTLLGPSGSGKTTLLMMVAGLVPPSGGEIWIDGRLATYAPPNKRDIGIVFQNYALFPHLTVFENIAFPLRMRRLPAGEIAAAVARVLDIVRLPHVAKRLPRELSGGQQQRIALARCMVYEPSIILMDEPLGALDRQLRDQMQLEIKDLHARLGITILYVTHDQEEAMSLSDRICLMNNGRIEQLGTPAELYFRPHSTFVAEFLGESNLLDAVVSAPGDPSLLDGPGGLRLCVRGGGDLAAGERVRLVLRPEHVRLLAAGEHADNVAAGEVKETVFVGGVTRFFVALPGGAVLSAKQLTPGLGGLPRPGEAVRLGWNAEHMVVLPTAAGAR